MCKQLLILEFAITFSMFSGQNCVFMLGSFASHEIRWITITKESCWCGLLWLLPNQKGENYVNLRHLKMPLNCWMVHNYEIESKYWCIAQSRSLQCHLHTCCYNSKLCFLKLIVAPSGSFQWNILWTPDHLSSVMTPFEELYFVWKTNNFVQCEKHQK